MERTENLLIHIRRDMEAAGWKIASETFDHDFVWAGTLTAEKKDGFYTSFLHVAVKDGKLVGCWLMECEQRPKRGEIWTFCTSYENREGEYVLSSSYEAYEEEINLLEDFPDFLFKYMYPVTEK